MKKRIKRFRAREQKASQFAELWTIEKLQAATNRKTNEQFTSAYLPQEPVTVESIRAAMKEVRAIIDAQKRRDEEARKNKQLWGNVLAVCQADYDAIKARTVQVAQPDNCIVSLWGITVYVDPTLEPGQIKCGYEWGFSEAPKIPLRRHSILDEVMEWKPEPFRFR